MKSLFLLQYCQKRAPDFEHNNETKKKAHFVLTNPRYGNKIIYIIKLFNKVYLKEEKKGDLSWKVR